MVDQCAVMPPCEESTSASWAQEVAIADCIETPVEPVIVMPGSPSKGLWKARKAARQEEKTWLCPTVDAKDSTGILRVNQIPAFFSARKAWSDRAKPSLEGGLDRIRLRTTLERRDRSWNEPSEESVQARHLTHHRPRVIDARWYVCSVRHHYW